MCSKILVWILAWFWIGSQIAVGAGTLAADAQTQFETKYKAWLLSRQATISTSSVLDAKAMFDTQAFKDIVALGPEALPDIMVRLQQDHLLGYAHFGISKFRFHVNRSGQSPEQYRWTAEEFADIQGKTGPPDSREVLLRWWRENPKWTADRFSKLYAEWQLLSGEGKEEEAEAQYQAIKDLGIAALPYMMERVKHGDKGLMPAISYLTDSGVPGGAQAADCLAWWEKNKEKWTIPFGPLPAEPPKAEEGKGAKAQPEGATAAPAKPEGTAAARDAGQVPPEVQELRRLEEAARKAYEEGRRKAEQPKSQAPPP